MLLFTTKEKLELQNISRSNTYQIIFRNKVLTRGPDFSKNSKEIALEFCKIHYGCDRLCLLVEHPNYLSLWKEYNNNEMEKTESSQQQLSQISLDGKFFSYCQQELAELIGPIAFQICTHEAENSNLEVEKFIKAISKQIPDKDRAKKFEQRLLALL